MMPVFNLSCNDRVLNWLTRVDTQYDEATPEKVKEADYVRAKESLGLGNITNNYFFFSARPYSQPASRSWFSGDRTTNSHNTTYVDNSVHVHNAPVDLSSDSEDAKGSSKKKKTKEEKTDWKGIAAITVVSTAIAGISIFVYARLSKAAEEAVNYLENTKRIKLWAKTIAIFPSSDPRMAQIAQTQLKIAQIAQTQLKIDQRAVDKITNYKYSILTSLVGTLAMAGGGITILAAAPALATAGTTAVVAGGVLNSLAVMYAAYNCGMHWSDEKDGRNALDQVKQSISIPDLITVFKPNTQLQNHHNTGELHSQPSYDYAEHSSQPPAYNEFHPSEDPPSYEESELREAISNQRATGIYPDFPAPSAPSYQSL